LQSTQGYFDAGANAWPACESHHFGFKVAIWLSEMGRHLERLQDCKKRLLVGNISGAVGTHAAFREKGKELQKGVRSIGPGCASHRQPYAAEGSVFRVRSGSRDTGDHLGKIGHEVFTLQRPEISELEEPFETENRSVQVRCPINESFPK
jgi:adenylosuccinate lyase